MIKITWAWQFQINRIVYLINEYKNNVICLWAERMWMMSVDKVQGRFLTMDEFNKLSPEEQERYNSSGTKERKQITVDFRQKSNDSGKGIAIQSAEATPLSPEQEARKRISGKVAEYEKMPDKELVKLRNQLEAKREQSGDDQNFKDSDIALAQVEKERVTESTKDILEMF